MGLRFEEPWQKFEWSPEQKNSIFRDWAEYYARNQRLHIADKYFGMALDLKPDSRVMCHHSMVKRRMAKTDPHLLYRMIDATKTKKYTHAAEVNLEVCKTLFELNRFEECKIMLHNNLREGMGGTKDMFENYLCVVNEVFNDTVGDSMWPFVLQNEKHFPVIVEKLKQKGYVEKRHLWKLLLDMGKCDVLSVLEKEEIPVSPLSLAKRDRTTKVLDQIYMNRNWIDVLFLEALKDNEKPVILSQAKVTSEHLSNLMTDSCKAVSLFIKMLKARSPLYNEKKRKCPHKKVCDRFTQENFYRIQYQTRRNMNSILRSIHKMRSMGKLEKLSSFIENVMGDYVMLKTLRVMPWKFEFINEVYNTLAMAYTDAFTLKKLPTKLKKKPANEQMQALLDLNLQKLRERGNNQFVFGERKEEEDAAIAARRRLLVNRLEKRLRFAQYPIESAYLMHALAYVHLPAGNFEECCAMARKGVVVAKECNSFIWQFLCTMIIVKAHITLHKVERAKLALHAARILTKRLSSHELYEFVDYLYNMNDLVLQGKKRSQSMDSMRRRKGSKSRMSVSNTRFETVGPDEQESVQSTHKF